jgi:ribulose-phosphate 3-epimerase
VAVNPETSFEEFADYLPDVDMVLLMTVHPGFGGQAFMGEVVPKIRRTKEAIEAGGLDVAIEVDGGIDEETAPIVAEAGASVFVAGSAIFGASDPEAAAHRIRVAAESVERR